MGLRELQILDSVYRQGRENVSEVLAELPLAVIVFGGEAMSARGYYLGNFELQTSNYVLVLLPINSTFAALII